MQTEHAATRYSVVLKAVLAQFAFGLITFAVWTQTFTIPEFGGLVTGMLFGQAIGCTITGCFVLLAKDKAVRLIVRDGAETRDAHQVGS